MQNDLFTLEETHVEQFYRDGYFMAPKLLSRENVDAINACYVKQIAEMEGTEWRSMGFDDEAQAILKSSRLIQMFEQILGGPTRLWLGMYAVVPPRGRGLEWHQDNMYTHVLGHMMNAFVALDDISSENAGLWIAPRTHLLGRQSNLNAPGEHRRAADPDNPEAVPPLKAGDALFFHRELLHHSKENQTDVPRRAFAFQVSSAYCRYAETGKLLEDREILAG